MIKLIKKTLLCASALTLMIATGVASAAPLSGFVYTANERDASISEIALETGQVRTFKAPIVAHNVQITPDGAFLLAVGMTAEGHEKEGGEVQRRGRRPSEGSQTAVGIQGRHCSR